MTTTALPGAAAPANRPAASAPAGVNALLLAAIDGDTAMTQTLLAAGASSVEALTAPLLAAARAGHRAIVELLLDHGAPIGGRDHLGRDPLYWAAYFGHREVVATLLERGADPQAQDLDGATALHGAAGNVTDPLVLRDLIDGGARVDAQDRGGNTPLSIAEREGENDAAAAMRAWATGRAAAI